MPTNLMSFIMQLGIVTIFRDYTKLHNEWRFHVRDKKDGIQPLDNLQA